MEQDSTGVGNDVGGDEIGFDGACVIFSQDVLVSEDGPEFRWRQQAAFVSPR